MTGSLNLKKIKSLRERVLIALEDIRPYILSDGGDIKLVKILNNKVYIKLLGACETCPMREFTLTIGIDTSVKEQAPEIEEVILVK